VILAGGMEDGHGGISKQHLKELMFLCQNSEVKDRPCVPTNCVSSEHRKNQGGDRNLPTLYQAFCLHSLAEISEEVLVSFCRGFFSGFSEIWAISQADVIWRLACVIGKNLRQLKVTLEEKMSEEMYFLRGQHNDFPLDESHSRSHCTQAWQYSQKASGKYC
jgi:hypothetical protein